MPRATGVLLDERVERAGVLEAEAFLVVVDLVVVLDLVVPVVFLVVAIIIGIVPSSVRDPFQLQG